MYTYICNTLSLSLSIYIYIYMHISLSLSIYIYIERERKMYVHKCSGSQVSSLGAAARPIPEGPGTEQSERPLLETPRGRLPR